MDTTTPAGAARHLFVAEAYGHVGAHVFNIGGGSGIRDKGIGIAQPGNFRDAIADFVHHAGGLAVAPHESPWRTENGGNPERFAERLARQRQQGRENGKQPDNFHFHHFFRGVKSMDPVHSVCPICLDVLHDDQLSIIVVPLEGPRLPRRPIRFQEGTYPSNATSPRRQANRAASRGVVAGTARPGSAMPGASTG